MAKLLLIEDDIELVTMVAEWLSAEYEVEVAHDGQEGLAKLQGSEYDVIVLDWRLPKLPGIEVCREYRAAGGTTPIIMLTGRSSVEDREEGLDTGADDYLVKPFSMRELTSRLKALRRRGISGCQRRFDLWRHQARPQANTGLPKATSLSICCPKSLPLLEFLMRHPDEVFSSDNLLARVWSTDGETGRRRGQDFD